MQFQVVAEDLQFPEGPVAMSDGSVLLVEIRRKTLTRILPNGRQEIVAQLDGGPNGAAIGPDEALIGGSSASLRVRPCAADVRRIMHARHERDRPFR